MLVLVVGGGGGVILGEVKARPNDIISFSLDYISKSKVQTSNPSSSPISLDTPARPADFFDSYIIPSAPNTLLGPVFRYPFNRLTNSFQPLAEGSHWSIRAS